MSVIGALGGLKSFLKVKSHANISSMTFTLFRLSAALLLACSILTTSRQIFGQPIHCNIHTGTVTLEVFEAYCYMTGTYTLMEDGAANTSLLHGGLGPALGRRDPSTELHSYYQWVCLVLVLQAAACYLPWHAWKAAEGGRVGRLLAKVSGDPLTETSVDDQVANLGDFLLSHRGWFDSAATKLLGCEAACLLSALGQLYTTDLLLGGRFLPLGAALGDYFELRRELSTVFPTLVMCNMRLFGSTGSIVGVSGVCALPVNIVNEKIFLVLWFVFLVLSLVSLVQLVGRAALLAAGPRACLAPLGPRRLLARGSFGDTVLLQLIAANCDSSQFAALVRLVTREQELAESQAGGRQVAGQGAGQGDLAPGGRSFVKNV